MASVAVGVDFGSQYVKLAKLRKRGQHLVIERLVKLARNDGEVLSKLHASGARATKAVMGIPGRGAILRYTTVPPVPSYRLKMIVEYEIGELVAKSNEAVSSDFRVLNVPREISADFTVMVAMSKDDFVLNYMSELQAGGVGVSDAIPTPLAVYNAFLALNVAQEDANYLVVDIGATNVDIAITGGRELYYARSIGRGADEFTEAISEALRVGFPEAERIKHTEGAILIAGWSSNRQKMISDALRSAAEKLYSTLSSSVNFGLRQINQKNLSIDKIYLFGGGSNLPGLAEYLGSLFDKEVVAPQLRTMMHEQKGVVKLEDAVPDSDLREASEELREFAAAIGLAASRLDSGCVSMDLMPAEEKKKRFFKERTLFLYAAGAVLLLLLVVRLIAAYGISSAAGERNELLQSRMEEANQRLFALNKLAKENEQITSALRQAARLTEKGAFFTELLFLTRTREITPDGIKIDQMRLKEYDREDESASKEITVVISGEVVSPIGDEYEIVRKFRNRLERIETVKVAKIDPSRTRLDRGRFSFEISVTSGGVK